MIKDVILYSNGIIAVFDEQENQIPELQGSFFETREKLKKEDTEEASFYFTAWVDNTNKVCIPIPRRHFFCSTWDDKNKNLETKEALNERSTNDNFQWWRLPK